MIFKKTTDFTTFFSILHDDWKEAILAFWNDLKSTTNGYILEENSQIIAGGLVFSTCPPDMKYAEKEAEFWFQNGCFCIINGPNGRPFFNARTGF